MGIRTFSSAQAIKPSPPLRYLLMSAGVGLKFFPYRKSMGVGIAMRICYFAVFFSISVHRTMSGNAKIMKFFPARMAIAGFVSLYCHFKIISLTAPTSLKHIKLFIKITGLDFYLRPALQFPFGYRHDRGRPFGFLKTRL